VLQHNPQIAGEPRVRAVHNKIRTDRRAGVARFIGAAPQSRDHIGKPSIELFEVAAVGGRKRTDHPTAACGDYKINAT
jgi:hypothetical protein